MHLSLPRTVHSLRVLPGHLITIPAARALVLTGALWLFIFAVCKHTLWRDPHSGFFNDSKAYDLGYSSIRQAEAHDHIRHAHSNGDVARNDTSTVPVICAAMTTFNRPGRQYVNESIGSLLAGLTTEERSVLDLRLLFTHTEPSVHPDWNMTWLNLVDGWAGYNVSDETMNLLLQWESEPNFYAKGVFDYVYALQHCLSQSSAPYIAIFEDDIIFADGWLPKALSALADVRELTRSWLYLRLFYTETSLQWREPEDWMYSHRLWITAGAMIIVCSALVTTRLLHQPLRRQLDNPTVLVITLVAVPAYITLIFMIGKYNLMPLKGLVRMDRYGCCTQALIFPRFQVEGLVEYLRERGSGQTDSLIEDYGDAHSWERYALAPQVVQHVGLVSSRDNLAINTKSTWAFWFETQSAKTLAMEHKALARHGVWRAQGAGLSP